MQNLYDFDTSQVVQILFAKTQSERPNLYQNHANSALMLDFNNVCTVFTDRGLFACFENAEFVSSWALGPFENENAGPLGIWPNPNIRP